MSEQSQSESSPSQALPPVEIRRGAFARLTIYEVEESELEILSRGSPDSLYLNFAIFLISIALSFLVTLLTSEVSSRVFTVFVCVTVIGFLLGIFLLILWFRNRKSVSVLVQKIRDRLPPEAFQLSPDEAASVVSGIGEDQSQSLLKLKEDQK